MKISTRGRYAVRIMLEIAQAEDGGVVPVSVISQRQNISKKYLEIILPPLVKAGLLEAVRGKYGGYRLVKAPEEYAVKDILFLEEGSLAPVTCLSCGERENTCPRKEYCKTLPMWLKFQHVTEDFFGSITLRDLLEGNI